MVPASRTSWSRGRYYGKALQIRRAALGEKHPRVGGAYNNMGNVYNSQGKYDEALEYDQLAPSTATI